MIPVMGGSWNSGHSCNDRHALEQFLLEYHSSTVEDKNKPKDEYMQYNSYR